VGDFIAFVCDQLRPWAPVAARRMFGGHGIFRSDIMFALVHADTLYFRTDAATSAEYAAAGMEPFRYDRAGRSVALGYHEVPADLLDEPDRLAAWADKAYRVALRRRAPAAAARRASSMQG
jgi:DNA transformation protein and related proteins